MNTQLMQRRRAIEALEARAPQTVWRLCPIVYRTELTVSLCDSGGKIETGKIVLVDSVHSDRNGPFSVIEFSTNESLYVISY